MAEVVVTLSGDEAKLFRAQQKLIQQQIEMETGYTDIERAAKKAGQEAEAAARKTAAEAAKVDKLYDEQTASLKLQLVELNKGKVAASEMRAIQQGMTKEQAAHLRSLTQQIDVTKKNADATKKLKTASSEAFDPTRLFSFLAPMGVLTTTIGSATAAWRTYRKAQEDAFGSLNANEQGDKRLAQIAETPADLAALQAKADKAAIASGVDRNVAREVLFTARSENFTKDYEDILNASTVIDPRAAAGAAGQIPALFQGKIGPAESVSLGLKAAKDSRLNFEQLTSALPQASEGGAIAKASPEETFAVASVLASRFKSGETAGDRIKAFSARTGLDDRFAGKGIIGGFEAVKALPEDERKKFLGDSQELNAAYVVINEELDTIKERLAGLQKERADFAKGGGALRDQVALAEVNPAIIARKKVNAAKIKLEIEKENNLGAGSVTAKLAEAGASTLIEERKSSIGERFLTESLNNVGATSALTGAGFSSDKAASITAGAGGAIAKGGGNASLIASNLLGLLLPSSQTATQPTDGAVGRQSSASDRDLMLQQNELLSEIASKVGGTGSTPALNTPTSNSPGPSADAIRSQARQGANQ